LCQIRSGDIDGGIDQAYTAMTALPRAQYNSPIVQVSRDVATAVSPTESGRENVRAFRAYLRDLQVA
ncbi:hypothetical protein, partial [Frankia sp. CpI1-P]